MCGLIKYTLTIWLYRLGLGSSSFNFSLYRGIASLCNSIYMLRNLQRYSNWITLITLATAKELVSDNGRGSKIFQIVYFTFYNYPYK